MLSIIGGFIFGFFGVDLLIKTSKVGSMAKSAALTALGAALMIIGIVTGI